MGRTPQLTDQKILETVTRPLVVRRLVPPA
jgi:hypothetical protein